MRISVVGPRLSGMGGVETVLTAVDRELLRQGHEPLYLFAGPPTADATWDVQLGPRVRYFARQTFGRHGHGDDRHSTFVDCVLDLSAALHRLPQPDVLIASAPSYVTAVRLAAVALPRVPLCVSWVHASLTAFGAGGAAMMRFADGHLAISDGLARQLADIDPSKPVYTVYNPVPGIPACGVPRSDMPTFLYLGRLNNRQKRIDRLLRIIAKLQPREFRLRVFGAVTRDDEAPVEELQRLARELSISDRVEWMGWQSDPWHQIASATALLLTSDFEGFGCVLAEALARGVPVVATDCPVGPRDIVRTDENGWLFAPDDEDGFARCLCEIIDGGLTLPTATSCQESVSRFNPARVVSRMTNVLARWDAALPNTA